MPSKFDRRSFLAQTTAFTSAGLLSVPTAWSASLTPDRRLAPTGLNPSAFEDLVGAEFKILGARRPTTLRLVDVRDLRIANDVGRPRDVRRDPFSLLYVASRQDNLEPGAYRIEHPRLGRLDLYLHQCGPRDSTMVQYEVIFN